MDPSKLVKGVSALTQIAKANQTAANSEHAVSPLITQPMRDFHRSLMGDIQKRAEDMAARVAERDWKYSIGDRILTPKGQVLEIQGQTWVGGKNGGPRYRTERVDIPAGSEGHYKADAIADLLEDEQYQLMGGPKNFAEGGLAKMNFREPKQNEHTRSYTQDLSIGHGTGLQDLKRGVSNWGPEILGFAGDIGDVVTNIIQRVQGKRGPNIRPGTMGDSARQRFGQHAAPKHTESVAQEPYETPPLETIANIANPFMFLSPTKLLALAEKYPHMASIAGILSGLPAEVGVSASPLQGALGIIKGRGGNWLNQDIDKIVKMAKGRPYFRHRDRYLPMEEYNRSVEPGMGHSPERFPFIDPKTGELFSPTEAKRILGERAAESWISGPFAKYLKRDWGTEDDPILKVLNEGKDFRATPPEAQAITKHGSNTHSNIGLIGKTPQAKAFEYATDNAITPVPARELQPPWMVQNGPGTYDLSHNLGNIDDIFIRPGLTEFALNTPSDYRFIPTEEAALEEANQTIQRLYANQMGADAEWLSKVPDETIVHQVDYPSFALSDTGLDQLTGWVRRAAYDGTITPEQLNSGHFSVEAAARALSDILEKQQAAELARQQAASRNAATVMHKEYADNPEGFHWVEFKLPEGAGPIPDPGHPALRGPYGEVPQADQDRLLARAKRTVNDHYDTSKMEAAEIDALVDEHMADLVDEWKAQNRSAPMKILQEALTYEGDMMGHCIGGYCPDVASGRTRLFSLRDSTGKPHVSIQSSPDGKRYLKDEIYQKSGGLEELYDAKHGEGAFKELTHGAGAPGMSTSDASRFQRNLDDEHDIVRWLLDNKYPHLLDDAWLTPPDKSLFQIKGSGKKDPLQNITQADAPKLYPFIQDFIREGGYNQVDDLQNTGMVPIQAVRDFNTLRAGSTFEAHPDFIKHLDDHLAQGHTYLPQDALQKMFEDLHGGESAGPMFAKGGLVKTYPEGHFDDLEMFLGLK